MARGSPLLNPWLDDGDVQLYHGDALTILDQLPARSVQACVTSPPYWGLRDYGAESQIGLERTPDEYVARLVAVFRGVGRVLRDDGTLWLNLGDSYSGAGYRNHANTGGAQRDVGGKQHHLLVSATGLKPKDLVGIPWRAAFAFQADGWYLRSDIVWSKPNPMPESVTDRPTKAHEYVFLLSKQPRYYWDADAIREPHARVWDAGTNGAVGANAGHGDWGQSGVGTPAPNPAGRNVRSVWEIVAQPTREAHFATFPEELVRRCILAGSKPGDIVLDPFIGSGTTALVARKHQRRAIGIDLSEEYLLIAARRTQQMSLLA